MSDSAGMQMEDPLQVLRITLATTYRHAATPDFITNLYALTALLSISLILSVSSIVFRYKAGNFWCV